MSSCWWLCFFVRVFFFAVCAVRGAVLPLLRPPAHLCARTTRTTATTKTTLLLPPFVCLPGFHNNTLICYIIVPHVRKRVTWICSSEPPPAERSALEVLSYQTCGSRAGKLGGGSVAAAHLVSLPSFLQCFYLFIWSHLKTHNRGYRFGLPIVFVQVFKSLLLLLLLFFFPQHSTTCAKKERGKGRRFVASRIRGGKRQKRRVKGAVSGRLSR